VSVGRLRVCFVGVTYKSFERKCNVGCITKLRSKRGNKAGGCLFSAITELRSVKDKLVL